jgi:hypothetical protein
LGALHRNTEVKKAGAPDEVLGLVYDGLNNDGYCYPVYDEWLNELFNERFSYTEMVNTMMIGLALTPSRRICFTV